MERLHGKKAVFYIQHSLNKRSYRELATMFKVSRGSIERYVHSRQYAEFVLLIEGDAALDDIMRNSPEWNVQTVLDLNAESEKDIREGLKEKYPFLFRRKDEE